MESDWSALNIFLLQVPLKEKWYLETPGSDLGPQSVERV